MFALVAQPCFTEVGFALHFLRFPSEIYLMTRFYFFITRTSLKIIIAVDLLGLFLYPSADIYLAILFIECLGKREDFFSVTLKEICLTGKVCRQLLYRRSPHFFSCAALEAAAC